MGLACAGIVVVLVGVLLIRSAPGMVGGAAPAGSTLSEPRSTTTAAAPTTESAPKRVPTSKSRETARTPPKVTKKLEIPNKGSGEFVRADIAAKSSSKKGTMIRYDLRVEKGLPFDPEDSATLVHQILNDKRSWVGAGKWRFELVASADKADMTAYIATPKTTDKLCAPLLTGGKVSCQNGKRVVLNADRWAFGAKTYGKDVTNYRRYLVNHEFGHRLGYQHVKCPGRGKWAPVMMQQTKGLGGCKANLWPSPNRG